ncbi:hypothetical protein ACJIZ3_008353 [Penstemon smallii]|uniref:Peptidase S26 domain-containing protein n=1 Tax=Penstemon smallii TaxID=265156 RepID=A0ABD3TB83_9LAMI
MGMETLKRLTPFVKESFHQTLRVLKFFCCLHVTNTYICTPAYLVGPSMLPTLTEGNIVLAERITTRLGKIESGDVVLVRSPDNPRKIVTKRVKGVEGDVVSYLLEPSTSDEQMSTVVPKGHVWVEGDNAYCSHDSRQFGPIPYALLHARIFFKVWPPKDLSSIGNKVPYI